MAEWRSAYNGESMGIGGEVDRVRMTAWRVNALACASKGYLHVGGEK